MVKVYLKHVVQARRCCHIFLFVFLFLSSLFFSSSLLALNINTKTTISGDLEIKTNDGNLIVSDTLIVTGNLTLGNDVNLVINSGGVVLIYGDLITSNKVSLDIDSYLIVLGSLIHTSNSDKESATVSEDAHVYIFGDFDDAFSDTELGCAGGTEYEFGTENSCGHGGLDDFIDNEGNNPIFEEILQNNRIYKDNLISNPSTGELCLNGSVSLIIDDNNVISNIFWYKGSTRVETQGANPYSVSSVGEYYAVYKVGSQWYLTNTVVVEEGSFTITPPTFLSGNTVSCIPEFEEYDDFLNAATLFSAVFSTGGSAASTCGTIDPATFDYTDVYEEGACPKTVTRTYTLSDGTGSPATAEQVFILNDPTKPILTIQEAWIDYVTNDVDDNCVVRLTIPEPTISDCGLGTIDVAFSAGSVALTYDEENRRVTGDFPIGETVLSWTVTDACGNTATASQTITVEFPLTPISYDGGSTIPSEGSGAKPMLSSTHSYQVDGGTAESGYSYLWEIYSDFNHDEEIDDPNTPLATGFTMSPNNSGAEVGITFTGLTADEFYIISLIKTKTSTSCTKQELLPVIIRANTFDVALDDLDDDCQTVGTGTTKYFWNITFPAVATEPFEFDYEITMDGSPIQSGSVNNIRSSENWSLTPASGAAPLVQTEKSEPYKVVLYFTFNNIPDSEMAIGLSIQATDTYQVSDPNVSNNSDSLKAFEIPSISFD